MTLLTLESIAIPDLSPDSALTVRKASLRDVDAIHELIGYWATRGQMLVRSKALLARASAISGWSTPSRVTLSRGLPECAACTCSLPTWPRCAASPSILIFRA